MTAHTHRRAQPDRFTRDTSMHKPNNDIATTPDGKVYHVTVETLSTATAVVRADSPEQALAWAKAHADAVMRDDVPEYDWPTAIVYGPDGKPCRVATDSTETSP